MNERLMVHIGGIADFCRRQHILRLAIFGSALLDDRKVDLRTSAYPSRPCLPATRVLGMQRSR